MKRSDVFVYPQGSYEYVLLHGRWRRSRGKNVSATLPFLKNRSPRLSFLLACWHFQLTEGYLSVAVVDGIPYIGESMNVPGYLVRARRVRLDKDATLLMLMETGIYYPGGGQYIGAMGPVEEKPVFIGSTKAVPVNMNVWRSWYRFHSWGESGYFRQLFGALLE